MQTLDDGHAVTYSSTMIWALQSELWKPHATLAVGADCTSDYECISSHCAALDGRTSDMVAGVSEDKNNWGAKKCTHKYGWVVGSELDTAPTTTAPTAFPTQHILAGVATLTFDLELGCATGSVVKQPTGYSSAERTSLTAAVTEALALTSATSTVALVSMKSLHNFEDGNPTDPFVLDYTGYTEANALKGTMAKFAVTITETSARGVLDAIIAKLVTAQKTTFEEAVANEITCANDKIDLHSHSMTVQVTQAALPTMRPTVVPHTANDLHDCSCGTVMEINLGAKFVAVQDLANPIMFNNDHTINVRTHMDATRKCISAELKKSGITVRPCMINAVTDSSKTLKVHIGTGDYDSALSHDSAATTNTNGTNQGTDSVSSDTSAADALRATAWNSDVYDTEYKFTIAVKGQNMHEGNKVYDAMNIGSNELAAAINTCSDMNHNLGGVNAGAHELATAQLDTAWAQQWDTVAGTAGATDWTGDALVVTGQKARWVPEVNTAPYYAIKPSSIQLAYREGHCATKELDNSEPEDPNLDCVYSEWSTATSCSKTCGSGFTNQYRTIISASTGTGTACNASQTSQQTACMSTACVVPCVYSAWTSANLVDSNQNANSWANVVCQNASAAPATCDEETNANKKIRTRTLTNGAALDAAAEASSPPAGQNSAAQCVDLEEDQSCYSGTHCPIDCKRVDTEPTTSTCTASCGGGTETRTYRIETMARNDGFACPDLQSECDGFDGAKKTHCEANFLREDFNCNEEACPVDCTQGGWSNWGSCSKNCADQPPGTRLSGATQIRTRATTQDQEGAGASCGASTQSRLCALHPCGASVCAVTDTQSDNGKYPLTCTYENNIVYTHHVNDVHTGQLFMCYHNIVTSVCTCLCWDSATIAVGQSTSDKIAFLHQGEDNGNNRETPGNQHIDNADDHDQTHLLTGETVSGAQSTHDFKFGGRNSLTHTQAEWQAHEVAGRSSTAVNGDTTEKAYTNQDNVAKTTYYNRDGSASKLPAPYAADADSTNHL